jgi:hypothetical protein
MARKDSINPLDGLISQIDKMSEIKANQQKIIGQILINKLESAQNPLYQLSQFKLEQQKKMAGEYDQQMGSIYPTRGGQGAAIGTQDGDVFSQTGPVINRSSDGSFEYEADPKKATMIRLQMKQKRGMKFSPQEQRFYDNQKGMGKMDAQSFDQSSNLRKEFDSLSKDFRQVRDSYGRIVAAGKDPSGAGDLALIFNYMKILDPGSTVREGEFSNAQNSAGVDQKIRATYNRVLNGQRLAPEQRKDFIVTAKRLFGSQESVQKKSIERYSRLAEKNGLDPQDVITDLYDMGGEEPTSTDSGTGTGNVEVTLPKEITTTKQAIQYLASQGMNQEQAIQWLRSQ